MTYCRVGRRISVVCDTENTTGCFRIKKKEEGKILINHADPTYLRFVGHASVSCYKSVEHKRSRHGSA